MIPQIQTEAEYEEALALLELLAVAIVAYEVRNLGFVTPLPPTTAIEVLHNHEPVNGVINGYYIGDNEIVTGFDAAFWDNDDDAVYDEDN